MDLMRQDAISKHAQVNGLPEGTLKFVHQTRLLAPTQTPVCPVQHRYVYVTITAVTLAQDAAVKVDHA